MKIDRGSKVVLDTNVLLDATDLPEVVATADFSVCTRRFPC
jgi:hypothetical protein